MDEWISATRCWSPSPSPDGTTIAFVWDGEGRPQVRMHRRATGEEWSLDTGEELVSTVRWSPDGAWLAVETAPDGGERSNVCIIRPDGSDLRPIRGVGDADRGAVTLDRFTHTGSVLAITESDYDTTTAWLVDAESSQRQRVGSGHALQILDVSRDRRRVLLRRGRRGSRHVGIVDLDGTEGWHEIDARRGPGGPPGAVEHPVAITRDSSVVAGRFCPDGTQMYLLTDGGRERAALVRVEVATDARPMTPDVLAERDDAELERFALTEDASLAALVWNAEGRSEVDLLDITTGKCSAYAPPGDVVTSAVFSHDGDSLVMGIQAPEVPAAVWCHELSSDTTALICPQEEPTWSPGQLVHPSLEVVTTPDGLRLPGWLYRPRGQSGPLPTVIYLHGGPEAQERPVFTPLYQHLLARGIAVYAANVRGSSGFGRSFVNADNGAGRFAAIRDVATCVEHLVDTGVSDPERIGVMGRSYGGYLTLHGPAAVVLLLCGEAIEVSVDEAVVEQVAHRAPRKRGDVERPDELVGRAAVDVDGAVGRDLHPESLEQRAARFAVVGGVEELQREREDDGVERPLMGVDRVEAVLRGAGQPPVAGDRRIVLPGTDGRRRRRPT